ncbi:MAG: MFS transporter [Pseudomonadales bacterium]
MDKNPKAILENNPMNSWQWAAVLVTVGLNALDGFDVLSISFAAPGIASDWGIDRAALGWILSMELFGMAIGSITLGPVADKVGRRPTILFCLVAMTIGMAGAAYANGMQSLLFWRLLTGVGIGGMLAAINAAASEFSNLRWRGLAMAAMVIGYPIGGILGGLGVQHILGAGGWRDIFMFGAWATAAFIPLVWFFMPESPVFYDRRRAPGALERINPILARFGHQEATELSSLPESAEKTSLADIFKPGLMMVTVLVTLAYFAHITSFYYIIKWIPKIVVDMGFEARSAAAVLTWVNVGGAIGGAVFGYLATRMALRPLTIVTLLIASAMIVWFGRGSSDLHSLTVAVGITGFFTNAGVVGMYSLFAKVFPTHVRATGTGFAIGMGRGGAVLAPIAAGYLFQAGLGLQTVSIVMASGALCGAVLLYFLKENRN